MTLRGETRSVYSMKLSEATVSSSVRIRPAQESDIAAIVRFADRNIGADYFSADKVKSILCASRHNAIMCSFVLENFETQELEGIRLTYAPGVWPTRHPSQPIHPHLWRTQLTQTAYFQSLFVSSRFQNNGWGRRLSMASVENLKCLGARSVVCHSWDESPNNSSRKYLSSLGFEPVISIPNFWHEIDYECPRCGRGCTCTATEMILYI